MTTDNLYRFVRKQMNGACEYSQRDVGLALIVH